MHVRSGESGTSAIPGGRERERETQIIAAIVNYYLPFIIVSKTEKNPKPLKQTTA